MASEESAGLEPITAEPPPVGWLAPLGVTFTHVTFVHWRYEPELIAPLLPAGLVPGTFGAPGGGCTTGRAVGGAVPIGDVPAHLRWSAGADRPKLDTRGVRPWRVRWP